MNITQLLGETSLFSYSRNWGFVCLLYIKAENAVLLQTHVHVHNTYKRKYKTYMCYKRSCVCTEGIFTEQ